MAKNFQKDNHKFTKTESRVDSRNPQFNSSVNALGEAEAKGFDANLDKWVKFVSWSRWNPDLFFDLITPETGGIRLDLDQRVFLRCMARFLSCYAVFPRGLIASSR